MSHHISGGNGGVILQDAGGEGSVHLPGALWVHVLWVQDHGLRGLGEVAGVPPLHNEWT